MTERLVNPKNSLSEQDFAQRYGQIISAGVVAIENHVEAGEQTVVAEIDILYQENPGHRANMVIRQLLDGED